MFNIRLNLPSLCTKLIMRKPERSEIINKVKTNFVFAPSLLLYKFFVPVECTIRRIRIIISREKNTVLLVMKIIFTKPNVKEIAAI